MSLDIPTVTFTLIERFFYFFFKKRIECMLKQTTGLRCLAKKFFFGTRFSAKFRFFTNPFKSISRITHSLKSSCLQVTILVLTWRSFWDIILLRESHLQKRFGIRSSKTMFFVDEFYSSKVTEPRWCLESFFNLLVIKFLW